MSSSFGDIVAEETVFFMCDMQVKFVPVMQHFDDIITVTERLIEGGQILKIPLIVTEQYPKGLGNTIPQLNINHASVFPKNKFTMFIPEVEEIIMLKKPKHVVLFGIEAHICILQTVIDLLKHNIQVHVVADACTSRNLMDRLFAFERFRQMGAFVTTSESILFQLIKTKDHENFKQIQNLIKICAPTSGLIPEQKL